jgi:hypothetical protein
VRFHADESAWIGSSFVFEEYFKGRFNSPVWDQNYAGSDRQVVPITTNSTITRFFIGLGRRIGGIPRAELNLVWDFNMTAEQNAAEGRMPSAALLWWSRLPMAILAAAAIFLVYLVLRRSFGRLAAYSWTVLAAINSYFLLSFRRAMDEAALIFGICLILYCCMNCQRHPGRAGHCGSVGLGRARAGPGAPAFRRVQAGARCAVGLSGFPAAEPVPAAAPG